MPKLTLQFEDRVLKECGVGPQGVTIGRLPDNTVMIDNPAVSSRHARVYADASGYVIEDLDSTNGTFVNEKRVTRHSLANGDVILIGKHKLVFDQFGDAAAAEAPHTGPAVPDFGGTRKLETEHHKALLAKWEREAQEKKKAAAAAGDRTLPLAPPVVPRPAATAPVSGATAPSHASPAMPSSSISRTAVLRVLAGRADQVEYTLGGQTSVIGKADTALIRLKGWFKPRVAVAVARKGDLFQATAVGGKSLVNGQPLIGRQDLKDGDVLEVSGLTLEFRLK